MKRLMAVLLAGVMVLGGTVTAFAAPSPAGEMDQITAQNAVDDVTGEDITKNIRIVSGDEEKVLDMDGAEVTEDSVAKVAKDLGLGDDLQVVDIFDIYYNVDGKDQEYHGSATVTMQGVDIKATDKNVTVLHQNPDGTWVKLTVKEFGDGWVTVVFDKGFSPGAILVQKRADASAAAAADKKATTDKKASSNSSAAKKGASPKTGEAPITAMMLGVIAAAAAGMVISRKKFA